MSETLKNLIDEYDVISFDIFDTLLFRNVYKPTDIFKILDSIIYEEYGFENFYDIRVSCESLARKDVKNSECNYDEIYDLIEKKVDKKIFKFAKEKELSLEYDFIVENPFMKDIFNYCLKMNKKVYLISDMYLKKDFIEKLLSKAGYSNYKLFVSCECRESKGLGGLFELVCSEENLDKSKWLHIGDNQVSDYSKPLELGISSYRYKNIREYNLDIDPKTIEESIISAIQCNALYNGFNLSYWQKFGIECVYPIYFGYALWIYQLTKDKDNLFFISRDGYIVKKIFDLLPGLENMYMRYLYCSRKSSFIPSLLCVDDDTLIDSLASNSNLGYKLCDVLKNYGFEIKDDYLVKAKQFGFLSLDDIIELNNLESLYQFFSSIIGDIKESLSERFELVKDYLSQEGLNKFDKINVVDVGWVGSIQYSIQKIMNKKTYGYYFGVHKSSNKEEWGTSTFGYMFHRGNLLDDEKMIINNAMMYEFIFSAPHGTVLSYEKVDGEIKPILDNNENKDVVIEFQDSALSMIKKAIEYFSYFKSIDKYFCIGNYKKMIDKKDLNDLEQFSNIESDYKLGSLERVSFVPKFSIKEVEENYDEFCKRIHNTFWNEAYIITDGSIETIENKENEEKNIKKSSKGREIVRIIVPYKVRKKIKSILKK